MAEESKLHLLEFTIGCHHTISTGPYENIKVEAQVKYGVKRGTTDEEFKPLMQQAQAKLKEILRETYVSQKRQVQQNPQLQQR